MIMLRMCLVLVLGCVPAGAAFADEFRTGLWVLELRRDDAPVDTRKISIEMRGSGFVVHSATNNELDNPITQFAIDNNTVTFTIPEVELDCRLDPGTEQPSTWGGTCPPEAMPDPDNTLTVILRPPIGLDSSSEEETAEASQDDQVDTAAE